MLSIFAGYGDYEVHFDHLSVHRRFDNLVPHFIADKIYYCSRMVPRMGIGANCFRGWELEYLRVLAVFREYKLRALEISTGSALLIL